MLIDALDGGINLGRRHGGETVYGGIEMIAPLLMILSLCYLLTAPIVRRYFEPQNGRLYFGLRAIVRVLLILGIVLSLLLGQQIF
jgi:hypothetical protein